MPKTKAIRQPARIRQVKPLKGVNVELLFSDGVVKTINLKKYLHGLAFEQIRSDQDYFRQVFIGPIGETVTWPNTADIDADVLRYDLTPAWMEKRARHKRTKKNSDQKTVQEPLVSKRIYLHPCQIKILAMIDSNLSAAVRQVVDAYQD